MSGKELFIRFTERAFRKLLSIYVFSYLPFGFEGRIWDLIVSVPNHCLSFYFEDDPIKAESAVVSTTFVPALKGMQLRNQQTDVAGIQTPVRLDGCPGYLHV